MSRGSRSWSGGIERSAGCSPGPTICGDRIRRLLDLSPSPDRAGAEGFDGGDLTVVRLAALHDGDDLVRGPA
jgi:hypothetical protein